MRFGAHLYFWRRAFTSRDHMKYISSRPTSRDSSKYLCAACRVVPPNKAIPAGSRRGAPRASPATVSTVPSPTDVSAFLFNRF